MCLLNNDTTVDTYWLEALIQGIKSDSSLGAIGSIVLDRGYEQEIQDMIFKKHKKGILTHVEGFDFVSMNENEIKRDIFYV